MVRSGAYFDVKRSRFREITGHDDVKSHPVSRDPS